uniref:Secreted protein n=1 Tax=Knipowitschia caucasica TaxID=637954 RepID=A0AAV2M8X4_KNICA
MLLLIGILPPPPPRVLFFFLRISSSASDQAFVSPTCFKQHAAACVQQMQMYWNSAIQESTAKGLSTCPGSGGEEGGGGGRNVLARALCAPPPIMENHQH